MKDVYMADTVIENNEFDPTVLAALIDRAQSSLVAFSQTVANTVPFQDKALLQSNFDEARLDHMAAESNYESVRDKGMRLSNSTKDYANKVLKARSEMCGKMRIMMKHESIYNEAVRSNSQIQACLDRSYEATELLTELLPDNDQDLGFDMRKHLSELSKALSVAFDKMQDIAEGENTKAAKFDLIKRQVNIESWKRLYGRPNEPFDPQMLSFVLDETTSAMADFNKAAGSDVQEKQFALQTQIDELEARMNDIRTQTAFQEHQAKLCHILALRAYVDHVDYIVRSNGAMDYDHVLRSHDWREVVAFDDVMHQAVRLGARHQGDGVHAVLSEMIDLPGVVLPESDLEELRHGFEWSILSRVKAEARVQLGKAKDRAIKECNKNCDGVIDLFKKQKALKDELSRLQNGGTLSLALMEKALDKAYEATEVLTEIETDFDFDMAAHLSALSAGISTVFKRMSERSDEKQWELSKRLTRVHSAWMPLYR
jgi:hypothetical protein